LIWPIKTKIGQTVNSRKSKSNALKQKLNQSTNCLPVTTLQGHIPMKKFVIFQNCQNREKKEGNPKEYFFGRMCGVC